MEVEAKDVVMRMVEDFSLMSESDSDEEEVKVPEVTLKLNEVVICSTYVNFRLRNPIFFSLHPPPLYSLNHPPFNSMTGALRVNVRSVMKIYSCGR